MKLDLCRQRRKVWFISSIFVALSIIGFLYSYFDPSIRSPLKPGLDFTGGTQIILERQCDLDCNKIDTREISQQLTNISFPSSNINSLPNLSNSKIQLLDNSQSLLIRIPFLNAIQTETVINSLTQAFGPFVKGNISIDAVGPSLGIQLLKSSLISLFAAFTGIALYISFRYDRTYAFLALTALFHDIIIVCGLFSWLGIIYKIEVDSLFAVSLLTIAGYSVNNTVVVFDRIREKSRSNKLITLFEQIDRAVSATLTRTLYTSATTLFPLISLMLFGGSTLYWFSVSLSLGVIVGAWSSIALAPSLLSKLSTSSNLN